MYVIICIILITTCIIQYIIFFPPIRAYMDDVTTLTSTIACTKRLLVNLYANITWAHMKLKPSKSRSISIVRGKLVDQRFHIDETPIPTVLEMPVKSLGRWFFIGRRFK